MHRYCTDKYVVYTSYAVSDIGNWQWNNVQNGTVFFCMDTNREPCIGTTLNETVPVSTSQWHWNGGVQYWNVYWDNIGKYHLIPLCSLG